jgi:hypothetical protein
MNHAWKRIQPDRLMFRCTECGVPVSVASEAELRDFPDNCGTLKTPRVRRRRRLKADKTGPGTFLKQAIARWTGEDPDGECGCGDWIRAMNRHGPVWCRNHLRQIVRHIREEAKDRGWMLTLVAAIPGVRWPIRHLVLTAIEQSEAAEAAAKQRDASGGSQSSDSSGTGSA